MPARKPSRTGQIKFSFWAFVLGLAVVIAMVAMNHKTLFKRYELTVDDIRMYWRATSKPLGVVKIAAIDDKSIAELGQWPFRRSIMAQFERELINYKVAVVGYDVLFSEQDNFDAARDSLVERLEKWGTTKVTAEQLLGESNDQAFADAIKAQGKTVLAYTFGSLDANGQTSGVMERQGFTTDLILPAPLSYNLARIPAGTVRELFGSKWYRPPTPILNQAAYSTGFVPIDSDDDGVMRAQIMVARFHDGNRVPLSLAVLRALANGGNLIINFGALGDQKVIIQTSDGQTAAEFPINEHGQMFVNFRGPEGTFPRISFTDILNHRVPDSELQGKILLVGMTARGGGDRFVVPTGADFPGVEIHANAIDNILQNDVIVRAWNNNIESLCGLVLGLLMVLAASFLPANLTAMAVVTLGGSYYLIARQMLWHNHRLIGIVYPLLMLVSTYVVMAGFRYYEENKEKRHLRHAFEHYLHPSVIASVVDNPEGLKLGGERRIITILFADIVNYTGLSESMKSDPVALVTMLNEYMTKMTDRILESEGVVDKIRGDGIMAFWGAPNEVPNHAQAAIDTAIAMLTELKRLNANDPRFTHVDIGIGIATGEAIAGNFGGANRFDYSVIGDTVNLASRLEELTRKFKSHLLVSRDTVAKAVGGSYIQRDIGLVRVKGKHDAVQVVEIIGHANDGVDPTLYNQFAHITELLHDGKADEARAALNNLQHENPTDGVIHMYAEKFAELKELPREMLFEFDTK
ncbi:MAG TPA: adenylate/guanylate cyclase domain-containing protein [Candidatus Binataceae bacterium]|nr:adenylate/guanylate cyclase domain-containing protein [Candidatus Binataceae bacterium]